MPETTPLIKAALNLRGGAGFDVYVPASITYLKERMRRTNVLIMESIMTVMTVATIGKKQMK